MQKLIKELQRRHVFRTVGLYVGGVWIVLQVAGLLLPIYDAPDWIMRALVTISIIGLPIAILLSWMFDVTDDGIQHDRDVSEASKALSTGRKANFAVIGLLSVGLMGSLFLNLKPRDTRVSDEMEPVSVLIADFSNLTGEEVFDGALEQVLSIGLEESSFVKAYDRTSAARVLAKINETATLDSAGARLVSAREGISVVVSGEVTKSADKYEVSVFEVDQINGELLAEFNQRARSKSEVLMVVGELALKLRRELGDINTEKSEQGQETFTTVSLEAMHDYVLAQRLAKDGKDDEAIGLYQSAVGYDPEFGRAYSGLALSATRLGMTDVASEAWEKALSFLDGMTERERYRTMGVYYSIVNRNSKKAIENYESLVQKFPADDVGFNNLAVAYFYELQFDKALEAGRKLVKVYPNRPVFLANYSLYAMYASDFETATEQAEKSLALNPNYPMAFLPFASAALVAGDIDGARQAYDKMAATGKRGESLANIGMADMHLWRGEAQAALELLQEGIEKDKLNSNTRAIATKTMMLAYAQIELSKDADQVVELIEDSLEQSSSTSQVVPAALMYIELDRIDEAKQIVSALEAKLDSQSRAYAKLLNGLVTLKTGDKTDAIDELQAGLQLTDFWLLRYYLGIAMTEAGHVTEAKFEFQKCADRLGEAYSLFLDDTPTFRYASELQTWKEELAARNFNNLQEQ
ncbi:MAG: tetratricopeptide repeat protein [Gammaproteobacteria bacterium]